jgi:hypothetical protein
MVADVRLLIQDTNTTTATAYTAAQITTFINTALLWWYENNERRIKYATIVATWSIGVLIQDGDATCLYPEILSVNYEGNAATKDVPLEELPWAELRDRQQYALATGTQTHYAKLKYGGAAVSASAQNKWKFALYPVPDAGVILKAVVRDYPVQLSADADIVDLGDFEGQCVSIIAAILAAPRAGRPELAQDLTAMLPQIIRDKLETHATRLEVKA